MKVPCRKTASCKNEHSFTALTRYIFTLGYTFTSVQNYSSFLDYNENRLPTFNIFPTICNQTINYHLSTMKLTSTINLSSLSKYQLTTVPLSSFHPPASLTSVHSSYFSLGHGSMQNN